MIEIDTSIFRDPTYQKRLEGLQQRLAEIEADGSFIAYASNRDLLDELEGLLTENRQRYQQDYLTNLQAYQAIQDEIANQKEGLHPSHSNILVSRFTEIEGKVVAKSYDENAAAKSLITSLTAELASYVTQFAGFKDGYKQYKIRLEFLSTQIWKETYDQLNQPLKALAAPTEIPKPEVWDWPEIKVQTAIAERKEAFSSLLQVVQGRKRLTKRILATENKPISRLEFDNFQQKIQRRIKNGNTKGYVLIATCLILVLAGIWFTPKVMTYLDEQKVWEESLQTDTWTTYQQYLSDYPTGKYRTLATERQMLLDYGKLENIITDRGRVYTYEGELDAGKAHGQGIATYANGDRYEGSWKAGQFWGQGNLTYADGSNYAGEWEANRFHGNGTYRNAEGSTYTGSWHQGKKQGQGSMVYADGSKYLGSWSEGLPRGHGTFSAGKKEPNIAFERSWNPGDSYTGNWENGKPHGTGTMRFGKNQMYQGKWNQGLKHGKGKISLSGNSYFEGMWQADSINGPGVFMSRFRDEARGSWKGRPQRVKLLDKYGLLLKAGKFENGLFIND